MLIFDKKTGLRLLLTLFTLLLFTELSAAALPPDFTNLSFGNRPRYRELVVEEAMKHLGTPYKLGACKPGAFDCSGFVYFVYQKFDFELPRTSKEQAREGRRLWCRRNIRKGDLLFFKGANSRKRRVAHVGIVISKKGEPIRFIHASTSRGVVVSTLETTYFKKRFKRAKRIRGLRKKIKK